MDDRTESLRSGLKGPKSKYIIWLVGFSKDAVEAPFVDSHYALPEILPHIVPEASIYEFPAFQPREEGSLGSRGARANEDQSDKKKDSQSQRFLGQLYADTIQHDASKLLEALRDNSETLSKRIILAGYGIGGLIIKKAVILANQNPLYYRIAVQLSNLVFFGTPHRNHDMESWEDLLLSVIQQSRLEIRGRISNVLPEIAAAAVEVGSVFYGLLGKYFIANVIEEKEILEFSGLKPLLVGELGTFGKGVEFERTVTKETTIPASLTWFRKKDLGELGVIRELFAPAYLLFDQGPPKDELTSYGNWISETSGNNNGINGLIYLRFLHILSPSRWLIYRSEPIASTDFDLARIYAAQLKGLKLETLKAGGSLQITGPSGYGKGSIIRLVCQQIREQTNRVIIEYLYEPSRAADATIYGMLVTCLHQLLSQRPNIFPAIEKQFIELVEWGTWTESNQWALLTNVLSRFPKLKFAFAFDLKQYKQHTEAIQEWMRTLGSYFNRNSTDFVYIIATEALVEDLTPIPPIILDIGFEKKEGSDSDEPRSKFIEAKIDLLIKRTPRLHFLQDERNKEIRLALVNRVRSLGTTFTTADYAMRYLGLHTPHLLTPDSIMNQINACPDSLDELYRHQILELKRHSEDLLKWCSLGLSWIVNSFRPLRVEEIAVAVAIDAGASLEDGSFLALRNKVSRGIESDLDINSGLFVRIENKLVNLSHTRDDFRQILKKADPENHLDLKDHAYLTRLCLRYLTMTFKHIESEEEWGRYLLHLAAPWKESPCSDETVQGMEFLDYTVETWFAHYNATDESQKTERFDNEVIDFLENDFLRKRWLQIYSTGGPSRKLWGDLKVDPRLNDFTDQNFFATFSKEQTHTALATANFLGLRSIAKRLEEKNGSISENTYEVKIRYGYSNHSEFYRDSFEDEFIKYSIRNGKISQLKASLDSNHFEPDNTSQGQVIINHWIYLAIQTGSLNKLKVLVESISHLLNGEPFPFLHDFRYGAIVSGDMDTIKYTFNLENEIKNIDTESLRSIDTQALKIALQFEYFSLLNDLKDTIPLGHLIVEKGLITPACYSSIEKARFIHSFCKEDQPLANGDDEDISYKPQPTNLHFATLSGKLDVVLYIIEHECETRKVQVSDLINSENSFGMTPLHIASALGYTHIVEHLIKLGANTTNRDSWKNSPIDLAAKHGHLPIIKRFPNLSLEDRDSAIVNAAEAGQLLIVEYLLDHKGFQIRDDAMNSYEIAMIKAAKYGYTEIVRRLIAAGVNPDGEFAERRLTSLHYAAEEGYFEIANILINEGANIDPCDLTRNTPLHLAATNGKVDVVRLLIDVGADVNAQNRAKESPLHLGIKYLDVVALLLKSGVKFNGLDSQGRSPLIHACRGATEDIDVVKLLLEAGADMEARDNGDLPPLHHAISAGHTAIVKLLAEYKGYLKKSDKEVLMNAVTLTIEASRVDIFIYLLQTSIELGVDLMELRDEEDLNILHLSGRHSPEILKTILEWEPKLEWEPILNALTDYGFTPFCESTFFNKLDSAEYLIKAGADIHLPSPSGWTALHSAYDSPQTSRFLIEKGIHINAQTDMQGTAVMHTCEGGSPLTLEVLLEHGADIRLQDSSGLTALHTSALYGRYAISKILLNYIENSADPDVDLKEQLGKRTNEGLTPLHLAIQSLREDVVRLFLKRGADMKEKTDSGQNCLDLAMKYTSSEKKAVLETLLSEGKKLDPPPWSPEDFERVVEDNFQDGLDDRILMLVDEMPSLLESPALASSLFKFKRGYIPYLRETNNEELVIKLVHKGLNPFKVWEFSQMSAFQHFFRCQTKFPRGFVEKCKEMITSDLSIFGDGFRELRIAIECRDEILWRLLSSLRPAASSQKDDDGWTLNHFIQQGRVTFAKAPNNLPPVSTKPSTLVLPEIWKNRSDNKDQDKLFEMAEDGLTVTFREHIDTDISLRSDHPFPPKRNGKIYFEIDIQDDGIGSDCTDSAVNIGFCGEFSCLADAHPGWFEWSFGYHGDDGRVCEENSDAYHDTKPTFEIGNVVGCGVDFDANEYFFTLDGQLEGHYQPRSPNILFRKLYPVIGHRGRGYKVLLNFGQRPFLWQDETPAKKLERRSTFAKFDSSRS